MATPALPVELEHDLLTTLREKLVKIGAIVARDGCYITNQMAQRRGASQSVPAPPTPDR